MSWNRFVRQAHRWVSMVFLIAVGFAAWAAFTGRSEESMLYYLPLPPLLLLMASGVYLLVLPWWHRRRGGDVAD